MAKYKLISVSGEQTFDLPAGQAVVVGRAVTSDLTIYDPTVSRQHAELRADERGLNVKDLGSSNGTFVNGTQITETVAAPGDVVTFGKVAFNLTEESPAGAPPPPDAFAARPPPPEATIVRKIDVPSSGELAAVAEGRTSGESLLKVLDANPSFCRYTVQHTLRPKELFPWSHQD